MADLNINFIYDEFGNKKKNSSKSTRLNTERYNSKQKNRFFDKKNLIPRTIYTKDTLLKKILSKKNLSTTISITGHLHHGKSTLTNLLASSVHLINDKFLMNTFSNLFFIEQETNLTLYPNVITLMFSSKKKKSNIFNLIDCPGHPDFQDQLISSMEISDGILLIIDIVEGVMLGTEISLRNAITRGLPLVIVLNAIDRLVLEFNSSAEEIHYRILVIIDEINMIIQKMLGLSCIQKNQFKYFNPLLNNVCFSSVIQGWTFTVEQFSEIYLSSQPSCCLSTKDLVFSIWNCWSFLKNKDNAERVFKSKKGFLFQDLILCPLIKLIFFNLTENFLNIRKFIEHELGVHNISFNELSSSSEKILNYCVSLFLGGCRDVKIIHNHSGIINALKEHIAPNKKLPLKNYFNEKLGRDFKCGFFTNFINLENSKKILALCKVLNGKIKNGSVLRVITTDAYFYKSQKYFTICVIKNLSISVARYTIDISEIPETNLVLIDGLENKAKESGIFTGLYDPYCYFDWFNSSIKRSLISSQIEKIIKILIKPISSGNLNFIFEILRLCCKIYPNLTCLIKSNGNIILSATSELYLDCILQNINDYLGNHMYEISNPYLSIKEIISEHKTDSYEFSSGGLILRIKKSTIEKKVFFPTLGFFNMFEKVFAFREKFPLINSISGGYLSYRLQEKQNIDKLDSNRIWFFDYDSIEPQHSFLKGVTGANFSVEQKSQISSEFRRIFYRGSSLFEPLGRIEIILGEEKPVSESFIQDFLRFRDNNSFIKSGIKTRLQEPVFLGEIILPDSYLSVVSKYLKLKSAKIISYGTFFWEKILVIRVQILGAVYLDFEKELSLLTQGEVHCFFLFDSWKINQ